MNSMISIFFMVLLTSLTGTFLHIIWAIAAKLWGHYNPKAAYNSLRIVWLSYLLPVVYFFAWKYFDCSFYRFIEETGVTQKSLMKTPLSKRIIFIAIILWICVFLILLCYYMKKYLEWHSFISVRRMETDTAVLEKLEECKKRLSIKKNLKLYYHSECSIPLCTGIFSKMILLPERNYSMEELDIVLFHELNHIKSRDLEMKLLSIIINLIHCFNPITYFLTHYVETWSEIQCDISSCKAGKGIFTTKRYFNVILLLLNKKEKQKLKGCVATALAENGSDIRGRISYMKKYQKTKGWMKTVAVTGMIVALAAGTTVSYVASSAALTGYDRYAADYRDYSWIREEADDCGDPAEEIIVPNAYEEWNITKPEEASDSVTRAGVEGKTYTWTLEPREVKTISNIYCLEGCHLSVTCNLSGSTGKYVTAGIIEPDGTGRLVKEKNCVAHDFELDENGYYSVVAVNNNSTTITVNLTYYTSYTN